MDNFYLKNELTLARVDECRSGLRKLLVGISPCIIGRKHHPLVNFLWLARPFFVRNSRLLLVNPKTIGAKTAPVGSAA